MSLPGLFHALSVVMLAIGGTAVVVAVSVVVFTYFEPHFRPFLHEGDEAGLDWSDATAVAEFREGSPAWAEADRVDARLTRALKRSVAVAVLAAVAFVATTATSTGNFRDDVREALGARYGATVDAASENALPGEPGDVSTLVLLRVAGQPKSCTVGAGESVRVLRVECDGKPLPVRRTVRQR